MENILLILTKLFFLISLFAAGIFAKYKKIISDKGEEELSRLFIDIFWPCLIVFSITAKLNKDDVVNNLSLPLLGVLTCFVGFGIGFIFSKISGFKGDEKKIFLFHSTINNFSFMVLPLAVSFLPEKGAGLLFMNNLGIFFVMWTLGVIILSGHTGFKNIVSRLFSPGLIATFAALIIVLTGLNKFIPKIAFDIFETLGAATIPLAMVVAGARIFSLGIHALKFNFWNISLGILRLIVIPGVLLLISFVLKFVFFFSNDVILIFMLVNVMPVSINSVGMAMTYKTSADLASQGIIFTHLFSVFTIPVYIILVQTFLLV